MGSGGNLPVGPGIWGFIAFFVLAISLWLLVRNMNNRLRRMAYRDRDEAAAQAEADRARDASTDRRDVETERDAFGDGSTRGRGAGDGPHDDGPPKEDRPRAD